MVFSFAIKNEKEVFVPFLLDTLVKENWAITITLNHFLLWKKIFIQPGSRSKSSVLVDILSKREVRSKVMTSVWKHVRNVIRSIQGRRLFSRRVPSTSSMHVRRRPKHSRSNSKKLLSIERSFLFKEKHEKDYSNRNLWLLNSAIVFTQNHRFLNN